MAARVGIDIIATDPDKCFAQRHVAHGTIDPENILKPIIDVAINNLPTCYPSSTVFLIAQAMAFRELYVVVFNGRCMILMLSQR